MLLRLLASGQTATLNVAADLTALQSTIILPHEQAVLNCLQQWFNKIEVCFETSGTTGAAKTFCFTHQQIQLSAQASIQAFGLNPQTRFLLCMQPQFVGAAMLVFRAAQLGATLAVASPSKNPLKDLPLAHGYNFVSLVPFQLSHILACPASTEKLKAIDNILIGGASLDPALEQAIEKHQLNAYHSYGMTETLSHIALKKIVSAIAFTCLPGVKINLNQEHCLVIETPWNKEPIVTKDLAKMNEDGSFQILGRFDFQINSGGIKFNPESIEQAIAAFLFTHQIEAPPFIIGWRKNEALGQEIVLITEGIQLPESVFEQVVNAIKTKYHPYAFPKAQLLLSAFLRNENGKIRRQETIESAHNQA